MKALSNKEIEILLVLAKDFSNDYNASSITKTVDITRQGALKVLKNLERKRFLKSKKLGKAIFYKVNLEDYYVSRTIGTLFMKEIRENMSRWVFEFDEFKNNVEVLMIFGSILRSPKKANDIDLLIVFKRENYDIIMKIIAEKNKTLPKPIHAVFQTMDDLRKNLKKRQEVVLNILKTGYVVHGPDKLLEVIKDVSVF
jgi:predicted nucleotidyltransferase